MQYLLDEDMRTELIGRIRSCSKPLQPETTEAEPQLQKLEGIRVVLFDIYGTLLTSGMGELGIHEAEEAPPPAGDALEAAGFICMGADAGERAAELLKNAIKANHEKTRAQGIDYPEIDICDIWEEVVSDLADEGQALGDVSPASLQRLAVEYECRINPVWPMTKIKETLTALKEAGIKLGVVSNAQFYTPLIMELFNAVTGWADGMFDQELCAWSYKLHTAKPSERLLAKSLEAVSAMGLTPEQTVYIGNDLKKDIKPAAHSGCHTILFAGDKKSLRLHENDPDCVGVVPDAVITELPQLKEILF